MSTELNLPQSFFSIRDKIYKDDPLYIRENIQEVGFLFSKLNPFLHETEIKIISNDNIRLVGIFNKNTIIDEVATAYFGFFESINDETIVKDSFKEMESWAKELGAKQIVGPLNFSTYFDYRIKTTIEDKRFFSEPYNPPYYQSLIENSGYETHTKYLTYDITNFDKVTTWQKKYGGNKILATLVRNYEFLKDDIFYL